MKLADVKPDPGSARWLTTQPGYMARRDSWLDETVTVRRVLGLAAFYIACIALPVVIALAFLR